MLKYLIEAKFEVEALLKVKESEGFLLYNIPFNSIRKRQTTAILHPESKSVRVFVKGAPEVVINLCS